MRSHISRINSSPFPYPIMHDIINEKISVISRFDRQNGVVMPVKFRWQGRDYSLNKLAYYHRFRIGRSLQHIFHVTDGHLDFRLRLDSDDLHWYLEEVTDGATN